jgi:hypothetical protein
MQALLSSKLWSGHLLKLELIFGKTVYINPTYIISVERAEEPNRIDSKTGRVVKYFDITMINEHVFRVPEIELDKFNMERPA